MGPVKPGKFWNSRLVWHFPGLEISGKALLVLESAGNLLNASLNQSKGVVYTVCEAKANVNKLSTLTVSENCFI